MASPVALAAGEYRNKSLNNLVTELINAGQQDLTGKHEINFMNPRYGWIYFAVSGKAMVRLNDEIEPLAVGKAAGASVEAMRRLPVGRYTLHIDGQPSGLIIRAIPALQYAFYDSGDSWNLAFGPYDWEFLAKDVLPNVNVMISTDKAQVNRLHLNDWKSSGRSWITSVTVPGSGREDITADEAYEFWAGSVGLNDPLMDGIIVDEFGGGVQPKYDAYRKAVERIYANPKFKAKTYSPYAPGGGILSAARSREFARASGAGGGYVCIEKYLKEQPTKAAAVLEIHKELTSGWNMPRFKQDWPEVAGRTVMVLGYMSAVGSSLNVNPGVDFKVFMDMQMQVLATESSYVGLGGIQQYHSGYADEETVRWAGRLFRHYAIEGKKNLLSDELGFKYQLEHITNPDFADGTNGWTIQPAESGSVVPKEHPKYGYLQFRYWPADGTGDRFLWMKRSAKKPNVFSQDIKNLVPGKLYSLKMITGDYQDLVQERSEKKLHAVSINLDNVEILPGEKKSFQKIFPNHYARPVGGFKGGHLYYMNYHWRVFRAKGTTAKLTVSDWKSEKEPGGPAGQELIYNFIEIQPYLE